MKNIEDIKIYTLEDCDKCLQLKLGLKNNNLPYTEYNISQNDLLGDQIEELFKCKLYPMVIIKEDILILPESKAKAPNIILYPSINELINLIIKLK
jgi:glutaredoxin